MLYHPARFLLLACLLLLGTGAARGQQTGLLLGLRYEVPEAEVPPHAIYRTDSTGPEAYRTLYLVRRGSDVTLLGSTPDLLIPRDSLFWRVGTKQSVYNSWVENFVWTAPEGIPPDLTGISAYNGEYCDGFRTQTIHYAGRDYLALEQHSAGYCEDAAHPWSARTLAVVPIDSTFHLGLPIVEVLGRSGQEALRAGAAARLAAMADEETRLRFAPEADAANWGLIRQEGRWRARGRLDPSAISEPYFADFLLELDLPGQLVQEGRPPSWKAVRAVAPEAVDALTSPRGDFVVILHPAALTAHTVEDGTIGPARLHLPLSGPSTAVMTQWAAGSEVARWARHLPTPARDTQPW